MINQTIPGNAGETLQAKEKIILEPGFRQAYTPLPKADDPPIIKASESRLGELKKRQVVVPRQVRVRSVSNPRGLSEVDLLRLLQTHGIGRPATYAGIVELLLRRKYVEQSQGGKLFITASGQQVCECLVQNYPEIFSPEFTARMERDLDAIVTGKSSYRAVLSEFWTQLNRKQSDEKPSTP